MSDEINPDSGGNRFGAKIVGKNDRSCTDSYTEDASPDQEIGHLEFLDAIFGTPPDGETICVSEGRPKSEGGVWFANMESTRRVVQRWKPAKDARAMYVSIATVNGETKPSGDGENNESGDYLLRARVNLVQVHVLVLDDIGTKATAPGGVEPTYKIETSPGNYQWGYRLEPTDRFDEFEALFKHCADQGWSDAGAGGSYRVVRIPGSANMKPANDGFLARITEWNPDRVWSLDDLADELGCDLTAVPAAPPARGQADAPVLDAAADPYLRLLKSERLVLPGEIHDGKLNIQCPFGKHEPGAASSTVYYVGSGSFSCLHETCDKRSSTDFRAALCEATGADPQAVEAEFEDARRPGVMAALSAAAQANLAAAGIVPAAGAADVSAELMGRVLNPPGLIGMIAKYHDGISRRDAPIFGVAAGLGAMSALCSGRYTTQMPDGESSTNLYILALGETGGGKEGIRKSVKDVLAAAQKKDHTINFASPQALYRALAARRCALWMPDEFGRYLAAAAKPNGGQDFMVNTAVMKLFGLALSSTKAVKYAKKTDNIEAVERPYLSVLATSTGGNVRDALTSEAVVDGTLNRFLLLEQVGLPPFLDRKPLGMTDALTKALEPFRPMGLLNDGVASLDANRIDITVEQDAAELLIAFRDDIDRRRRQDDLDNQAGALLSRGYEIAIRIAGGAAAGSSDPAAPVMDLRSARWAIDVVELSLAGMLRFGGRITDSPTERNAMDIVDFVTKATSGGGAGVRHAVGHHPQIPADSETGA
jgi:hypothetical protein